MRHLHSRRFPAWVGLAVLLVVTGVHVGADDWPEFRGKGRLGVWNETGLVDKFPEGGLPVGWRTPIERGYSGPSVAGGRVFLTDFRPTTGNKGIERAIALDENTGKILWTKEWEANYAGLELVYAIGPRATPTVDGDRVYVLGTMGQLFALDVKTGSVIWQKDYVKDFDASVPSWGITGAPLVDGDRLICLVGGEPDAKVMALDKMTGAVIWKALSSDWEPGYNQPIIIDAAGVRQLIIWHPKAVSSLDPATGKVYWEFAQRVDLGMTIPTPVQSGPYLLLTSQWHGALMLRLDQTKPGATLQWKGTGEQDRDWPSRDTINSVISTPVIQGDYVYGLDGTGGLRCLDVATGKQVWETTEVLKERSPHGTAFFVRNGDRYFINNDRGELILAKLSPKGFEEISRTKLIAPTHPYSRRRASGLAAVLWSHAAYANKHIVIRNDNEIVRFSLAKES
jgi:outer membrane protein assembly factor BamB